MFFLPRMLAGILVILNGVVICAQESQNVALPETPATATPVGEKDSAKPASPTPDTSPQPGENTEKPDPQKSDAENTSAATPEQLQQWIKDLVHQKFATRQAASQKLVQAGVTGMEAAAQATQTEDLELATRCLAVLTEGLTSKDKLVRNAANSALETLAKSDNQSVAQRARQALDTPRELPDIPRGLPPGFGQNLQMRGIQQIKIHAVKGVREITVTDNGKGIVLKDNNGKDITVTVTETVNGQKQTQTFAGKDEEDLKKNNPLGYALYKKYSRFNANGGVQIQIGGNAFGGNLLMPGVPPQLRRRTNPIKAGALLDEVDQLRQKLEDSNERLEKAANSDKPDSGELKKISQEIKATIKRLAEIKTESQLP